MVFPQHGACRGEIHRRSGGAQTDCPAQSPASPLCSHVTLNKLIVFSVCQVPHLYDEHSLVSHLQRPERFLRTLLRLPAPDTGTQPPALRWASGARCWDQASAAQSSSTGRAICQERAEREGRARKLGLHAEAGQ